MEQMVTEPRSTKMLSAEHGEVESFVGEQGRELERLLYQAHRDLRAARERPVPVHAADEVERTYRGRSRRALGTILGRVTVAQLSDGGRIGVQERHARRCVRRARRSTARRGVRAGLAAASVGGPVLKTPTAGTRAEVRSEYGGRVAPGRCLPGPARIRACATRATTAS
jgi:hypothetical protein